MTALQIPTKKGIKYMLIARHRKRKNIAQQMKGILFIFLLVIVIYTIVCSLLIERNRRQAIREFSAMSDLYTREIDNRFFRISRRLFYTVMELNQTDSSFYKNIEAIRKSWNTVEADNAVSKLRSVALSYTWDYGTEYRFFLYLKEDERLIHLSLTDSGYEESEKMERLLLEEISQMNNTPYSVKKKWANMSDQTDNYVFKIAQNEGIYFGCYVNIKNILEPFSDFILEGDGYVRLVDAEFNVVGELTNRRISESISKSNVVDSYSLIKNLNQAPFQVQMKISSEKVLGVMMGSLVVIGLLLAFLLLTGAIILLYLRRYLLLPVQRFADNLIKYDDGDYTYNITEGDLLELEQIDIQFKRMIHQIRRMKITLYEQELERQKIEMDYLKLQIRPHFYLNCLNFIHSMIDFHQYDNASKMTKITSDYLQYVFRNTNEMVPVSAEIQHCKDYLDILQLRYPGSFEAYFELHEEVVDAEVFPFLLQVFVENAAKHSLALERNVLISVTVFPEDREEGKYVNLYISDTGNGFPEDVLEKLKRGQSLMDDGKHVGIDNCMKRFRHYFNDDGEICFDNSPLGGAIVDIHIPLVY